MLLIALLGDAGLKTSGSFLLGL